MIDLKITLASTACFALMACQVGVGTPGHCAQNPASCTSTAPNQLAGSSLIERSKSVVSGSTGTGLSENTTTDNTETNVANTLAQLLSLSAPENFRIVERFNGTLRTAWDSAEKSPHSYTLYLNGKPVAEGVNLSSYTFTGLDDNENYEIAIEAFSADGKSPRVKISAFDTLSSETNNAGSGSGGSGSSGSGSSGSGSGGSGSGGSGSGGSGSGGSGSGGSGSGGSGSGGSGSGGSGSGGSGSGGSGSGGSGSGGSGSGGSGSGDSGSGDSGSGDSGSGDSNCPQGSLVSVCVGVGGIGLGIGL